MNDPHYSTSAAWKRQKIANFWIFSTLLLSSLPVGRSETQALRYPLLNPFHIFPNRLCSLVTVKKLIREQNIFLRGGASFADSTENVTGTTNQTQPANSTSDDEIQNMSSEVKILPKHQKRARIRHTSDMLFDLQERSAVSNPESVTLRQLIMQRSQEYKQDLLTKRSEDPTKKLPHPKKVLHFLAPKIPAIKHSPDVTLTIQTARSDIDSGVAACLIGTLAHVCEVYDNEILLQSRQKETEPDIHGSPRPISSSIDLVKDRRLEQVVECLLCGVDVKKRLQEYMTGYLDPKKPSDSNGDSHDVADILEGEQVEVREGVYIRDACRAAWGLAILGAHHCGTLGGTKVMDLLRALSMRIRDLLLSRLQLLRQGDLMEGFRALDENFAKLSPDQRLYELSEELAEDAATAMWTFACVRACTGMRSAALFETCCSILCQDPIEIRRLAQDAESSIGVYDVVDRLARSEDEVKDDDSPISGNATSIEEKIETEGLSYVFKTTKNEDMKETLIDWLSPNELTDVLWALALHGHSDSNVREELTLSENTAALKEIAFDRLIALLRQDNRFLEAIKENYDATGVQGRSNTRGYLTNESDTMTVEVVDAAALLASENAAKTAVLSSVGNITIDSPSKELVGSGEEVEIVDAATILQSSQEQREKEILVDENGSRTAIVGDVLAVDGEYIEGSGPIQVDPSADDREDSEETNHYTEPSVDVTSSSSEQLYFSAHDLCALAWAVTELRDNLKFEIVNLVINNFACLGEESVKTMTGSDLSNLAWAIAKHSQETGPWSRAYINKASLPLTIWIVKRALVASGGHLGGDASFEDVHILDPFQPPELSRLMWAVASTVENCSDSDAEYFPVLQELAMNAIVATGSSLSLFSAEDMVRIFWAFLELSDLDDALAKPAVSNALGRILAAIETVIMRWEWGRPGIRSDEADASNREAARFTSLFLRPRLSRRLLDQIIEEYNDLEEEDEKIVSLFEEEKRSKLPKLRDLGIDPATLCKAAGSYAKLSSFHPSIRGSYTLTRVTLKLLTSKNGRLLQEFSMPDLIRACEAAAINEGAGRGEDLVVGQFVRRFVQLLNGANDHEKTESPNDSHLKLSSVSPKEVSTLIWSLGELGAHHSMSDRDRDSAHRKLRLIYLDPLLSDDQLENLNTRQALRALRGMVAMKVTRTDKLLITKILKLIEPRIKVIWKEDDLCELAESLAMTRQALGAEGSERTEDESVNSTHAAENNTDDTGSVEKETNETHLVTNTTTKAQDATNGTQSIRNNTTMTVIEELRETTERMLSIVASQASARVESLKAESLRRILTVYSLLPFQADELVDSMQDEVIKRKSLLASAASAGSIEDILHQAAQNAMLTNGTVFSKVDDDNSPLAALRSGLRSIFSPVENNDVEDDKSREVMQFTEEVGSILKQVAASVTHVDGCLGQVSTSSNVHTDTAVQRIMEGTNFELGRCQELVDNYRRIEFATGRRRSRYDYERSQDIGKRLLSRLISR